MGEKGIDAMFHAALEAELRRRGRGAQAWLAKQIQKSPQYIHQLLKREVYGAEVSRRDIAKVLGYEYEEFLELGRKILEERGEKFDALPRVWTRERAAANVILFGEFRERPEIKLEDYYAAPLVAGEIAAGQGRMISEEEILSLVWIYSPELRDRKNHNLVAVQIDKKNGDSMRPTLFPGDIVLIDRDDPGSDIDAFRNGKIYAVRDGNGGASIKRLYRDDGNLIISSDNRDVAPIMAWSVNIQELIIGRIVWGWRNLLEA